MYIRNATGLRRAALALGLLVALSPGLASANDTREEALEQRISELERQLQALMEEVKAQREQPAPVAAAAPLPRATTTVGGKPAIQDVSITPAANPNTTFRVGGFVKADFMATRTGDGQLADSAVGRALYVPSQIPVGGSGSGTDYDAHAKFSRLNFGIDTVTDGGDKLGAFFEMDFFGNALGNQNSTNTYGVTLRHAYAYWNGWLAGQTWSNFMDLGALPEAVDFIGPTDGVIFVRQAQVRYTTGGFSVAIENPETLLIPNGGGGNLASDRGALPDLTLRYGWKGDWGSFGIGGLVRNLRIDRNATADVAAIDESSFGGAVTIGGKWNLGSSDDLRYQLTAGSGFSRYIGLGITGDAMLDADGDIDSLGGVAGYVAWRHAFSPKLRSNVMYARSQYDNDSDLTGFNVTKSVQSVRANILYSPFPKLDVGAELMFGKREVEGGAKGDLTRLQFTTKYSF